MVANTPRLMLELELEPKQQALERLLLSRPHMHSTAEGVEEVERDREPFSVASTVETGESLTKTTNATSIGRRISRRMSVPTWSTAMRESASKDVPPAATGPACDISQEGAPVNTRSWTKVISSALAIDFDEGANFLGALSRPGGIGNMSTFVKRRSLRSNSWRA